MKNSKIIITGAAGLVGQNLTLLMTELGYQNIVAMDKHQENLAILAQLNPQVKVVLADLAEPGLWQNEFKDAEAVIQLHAQITSLFPTEFIRNNVEATELVLKTISQYKVPYLIHVSSSVVNSVANDDYTQTKALQEKLVIESGIPTCILRPTLMFGWFDPKHLGWLAHFMEKVPVFPIPGKGDYIRQPLYSRDFCRIIISALEQERIGEVFDIVGLEDITYIDIIKTIKRVKGLKTIICKIPIGIFKGLLRLATWFTKKPPFTVDQLTALTAGDYFKGVNFAEEFAVEPTKINQALQETFCHTAYSQIKIRR